MTITEILTSRFHRLQLKGFRNGFFDESNTKFYAYTLLSLKDEEFDDLYRWFLKDKGHSYIRTLDDELYRIYQEDGCYNYKDILRLVKENIFKYVSVKFYGILYKGEWYILDECIYFDEDDENTVNKTLEGGQQMWDNSLFHPVPEYQDQIDYGAIINTLSQKLGKQVGWGKGGDLIYNYVKGLTPDEVPKKLIKQSLNFREFIGQPWLVANIKQKRKSKINQSFEAYINEAFFLPFIQLLKITRGGEFCQTQTLYHQDYYPLIYPHSKEQVICIVKAINKAGESRLYYFLFLFAQKRLFEWTKPLPSPADGHHSFYIEEDLKDLSTWGAEFDLHEPSITMDDPVFWEEHIFKKQGGRYLYLTELKIENHQPDIYTLL